MPLFIQSLIHSSHAVNFHFQATDGVFANLINSNCSDSTGTIHILGSLTQWTLFLLLLSNAVSVQCYRYYSLGINYLP